MQWIKRNLFLVIGGVVALALLGFAGFYLFTKIQEDQAVTTELDTATTKLEGLAKRDPYPNPENIAAAKEEGKRLQSFLGDVEKSFLPAPYPQELNNMQFRTYLDNTRARLLTDAKRAGVETPTNYWFTFGAQKGSMSFSANSLQPLATQLADITTLCEVLFDAKVNSLLWLKRVPIDKDDSSLGSQDYLSNAKPVTNTWSVSMPYEIAFQGFSSELASVLDGMAHLPYCYMVTNIVVEPAASAAAPSEQQAPAATDLYSRYGMRPPGSDRYGMGGRYGGRYGMAQPPPPPQPVVAQKTTVLEEKPLRFTLSVLAVKLKPQTAPPTQTPNKR